MEGQAEHLDEEVDRVAGQAALGPRSGNSLESTRQIVSALSTDAFKKIACAARGVFGSMRKMSPLTGYFTRVSFAAGGVGFSGAALCSWQMLFTLRA